MYRYATGTANRAMQYSEYRSRQAGNTGRWWPFGKDADKRAAEEIEAMYSQERAHFFSWLETLPEVEIVN